MKRIQHHQYGGPEVMLLEEFAPSRLRTGEALVRVMAAASNPMDHDVREGAAKMLTGCSFPRGFGYDFVGVVEAIGRGLPLLAITDFERPGGTKGGKLVETMAGATTQ